MDDVLVGKLKKNEHPIIQKLMNYNTEMEVQLKGEKPFTENLLYQSGDMNCGVFKVRGYAEEQSAIFYELRLWNSSAVSAFKSCLQNYIQKLDHAEYPITTYYNSLCPRIFNETI
ncbi:hypothetical protein MTO96_025840 [Rhipicephalus appendiculatus]